MLPNLERSNVNLTAQDMSSNLLEKRAELISLIDQGMNLDQPFPAIELKEGEEISPRQQRDLTPRVSPQGFGVINAAMNISGARLRPGGYVQAR